ncbi:MAG TPA: hypothetical protein VHU19_16515 [Pyrinomonadaceae bacterium]|jgi:hypothetical protein|nr:hypothetical protein [Pyrinomonadaceae bacterium]
MASSSCSESIPSDAIICRPTPGTPLHSDNTAQDPAQLVFADGLDDELVAACGEGSLARARVKN